MAENEGKSTMAATKKVAHKFLDMLVEYLVPIAAVFVGLFTGRDTWGGNNAMYDALSANADIQKASNWVSAGVFGGMFGAVGYGFWTLGHEDGLILKGVGRGVGAYFFGVSLSYLLVALETSTEESDGIIDDLIADIKGL
jgi:hypothetical protein